jgi:hypothetical protein
VGEVIFTKRMKIVSDVTFKLKGEVFFGKKRLPGSYNCNNLNKFKFIECFQAYLQRADS